MSAKVSPFFCVRCIFVRTMESEVRQFLSNYDSSEELIVIFYATWFLPSLKVKEQWEAKKGNEPVVFINVDEATALVEELQLVCVPAVYRFKNGEITDRKLSV